MPIIQRQSTSEPYISGLQGQTHDMNQQVNTPQYQNIMAGVPLGFIPMNTVSETSQTNDSSFQAQISNTGYMDVDMSMGVETGGININAANPNLWWDQSFEVIPAEQYGYSYTGGYQAPQGDSYYLV